jgi:hypothetical protein
VRFSGSSVSSLYATWPVPVGVAVPCGHHLWGTEKNDRCVKKLAYISVVLGATFVVWESYGTYVYPGFSLSVCFFLGASSLLECVLYVSLFL